MIFVESVTKRYGARTLLEEASWRAPEAKTVGLVGPNGAGKSTLLGIILGEIEPDGGQIVVPKGVTVGHLPQEVQLEHGERGLLDTVLHGREDLLALEAEIAEVERRMAAGEAEALAGVYANLRERFDREGGYQLRARGREIAVGMGFTPDDFDTPLASFSGGWRMRAMLAQLLLRRPDVLLLDEPTNHLDLESTEWLERFLARYGGTVIVVSHDRYFLNRMVDGILELEGGRLTEYPGSFERYRELKEEEYERLLAQAAQQEKEVARIEDFIERFRYKATKAAQVQSRVKMLEKMDRVDVPQEVLPNLDGFRFPQPPRTGKVVVKLEEVRQAYGDHVVYESLDFQALRGDKIALVGPNGAGKSTLLKLIAGQIAPQRGRVDLGAHVEIAYFAQHAVDQLDPSRTILEEMNATANFETAPKVRSILGAFGFSGATVDKKISVLSGGEKSRVALAKLMLEPRALLLLDEPTNHLDIPSREVLEEALRHFEGAFLVVSHDRHFINQVATKIVHVDDGQAVDYLGDYDYYRWKREEEGALIDEERAREAGQGDEDGKLSKKDVRRAAAELRKRKQQETRELQKLMEATETDIAQVEARIETIEAALAEPDVYDDPAKAGELNKEYAQLGDRLEALMGRWEETASELDAIEKRYAEEEAAFR